MIARTLLAAILLALLSLPGNAQTLTIGIKTETRTLDPHVYLVNPTISIARHIFDTLVHPNAHQAMQPGLALSWHATTPTTWDFVLRPDVRFHDGSMLSAEDVIFSLQRPEILSPRGGGVSSLVQEISAIEALDHTTIRIHTSTPFPLLPEYLSPVAILKRTSTAAARLDAQPMIGTGPFQLLGWERGGALRLARNAAYWAGPAPCERVTFRPIAADAVRVAALLSKDVDLIDAVPPPSTRMLEARHDIALSATASNRVIYLVVNLAASPDPDVQALSGAAMRTNPLADPRVRQALSIAIDRETLTNRLLEGHGTPASQFLPDLYPGTSPRLHVERYDPQTAKALLTVAGYGDGFALSLLASNDRNASEPMVAEAIAHMLSKIGVVTKVALRPSSVAATLLARGQFAVAFQGWGTETGEASMGLKAILGTRNRAPGWGNVNFGGYSDPSLDSLLDQAQTNFDPAARNALIARAVELGVSAMAAIPLYYQNAVWAMRSGLAYPARSDNYTFAYDVRREPAR
jgi:peptide/nickel transport system substrate-binding protein